MKITYENIQGDVKNITRVLKKGKIEIPSLWKIMRGGLALMLVMVVWQAIVVTSVAANHTARLYDDGYLSIAFTAAVGFIVFIAYTSVMGKYLSLPLSIREESLIFCFFKQKLKIYIFLWMVLNFILGVVIIFNGLNPFFLSGLVLISVVLSTSVFLADIGRYDLSLLSSVISEWKSKKPQKIND